MSEKHKELLQILFTPELEKVWYQQSSLKNSLPQANTFYNSAIDSYACLLQRLIQSNINYLVPIIKICFDNFLPIAPELAQTLKKNGVNLKQAEETKFANAHMILRMVCTNVPTYAQVMTKPISDHFPHYTQSALMHRCFIMNMIKMTEYAPATMNENLPPSSMLRGGCSRLTQIKAAA